MAAGAAASGVGDSAVDFLITEMDKAGLPGDKIAEMMRALGPRKALMSGSAVLHAIVSAAGGNGPDDPNRWTPGDFDIFIAPPGREDPGFPHASSAAAFARELLDENPKLNEVTPSPGDVYRWRIDCSDGRVPVIKILFARPGAPAIQLIEWTQDIQRVIDTFDFPVLASTFDGDRIRSSCHIQQLIDSNALFSEGSELHCGTPAGVERLAGRLAKYHDRGFGGWPQRIVVLQNGENAEGRPAEGMFGTTPRIGRELAEDHPLAEQYEVVRSGDSAALSFVGGSLTKAAR